MSIRATNAIRGSTVVKGATKAVFSNLASYADRKGCNAFPAQATLAEAAGVCVRTVRRALATLEAMGLIVRMGGKRSRQGRAVIVWKINLSALSKPDRRTDRPVKPLLKKEASRGKRMGEGDAAAILAHQYGWDTLVKWSKPAYDAAIARIVSRASPQACS